MNELLHNFIESLREELRQYGEWLALHEMLSEQVHSRSHHRSPEAVSAVNMQVDAVVATRRERAQRQRELAQSLHLPADCSIAALIPLLSKTYRPLVEALVEECNHLREHFRRRNVLPIDLWRDRPPAPRAANRRRGGAGTIA